MRSLPLFILRYSLVVAAVAAACYSFLLAGAWTLFKQDTADSIPRAVDLLPSRSDYLARLAAWRPADRVALLHRAVEVNPFDFNSYIQLGLNSELAEHRPAQAEVFYLQAAQVNHMYLPKWTLTNFYFRHENPQAFFRWAKEALAITPYSPDPIFAQMWQISDDKDKIAAAIPDIGRTLLAYAWYLSNQRKDLLIPPVVRRMDANSRAGEDLLGIMQDRMLAAGELEPALEVSTALTKATPTTSTPITNGDFKLRAYGHGFDWRFNQVPGVRIDQILDRNALHLRFDGDEPDHATLLSQYVPLAPGRAYQLGWDLDTATPGLAWSIHAGTESQMSEGTPWQFVAPANSRLALLSLEYSRPQGQLKLNGSVLLRKVECRLTR